MGILAQKLLIVGVWTTKYRSFHAAAKYGNREGAAGNWTAKPSVVAGV